MILTRSTFRELTAPGYFDFSDSQTEKTAAIIAWFDSVTQIAENQANLYDETFRLWMTRDYSSVTVSRHPWLLYLLKQNSIGWYQGSNTAAAAVLAYVAKSYPVRVAECFQEFFEYISAPPLSWTSGIGGIVSGYDTPALMAETLIVYSTAGSPPATPSPGTYIPREWTAPSGWSKTAASAAYYSRGYLDGTDIIWMTPRSTTGVAIMTDVADLASLPVSPSTGDLCGVLDDGTGDTGAVYYYDGSEWRKTTTPNEDAGSVFTDPPGEGSAVIAPDGEFVSSLTPPPSYGPTEGYGFYSIWGSFPVQSTGISVYLNLTEAGVASLGMIILLLRRIKPSLKALFMYYTTPTNPVYTLVEIYDEGSV